MLLGKKKKVCIFFFFSSYYIISMSHCSPGLKCMRERRRRCGGRQPGPGLGKELFFVELPRETGALEQVVHKKLLVLVGYQEERNIVAQWNS